MTTNVVAFKGNLPAFNINTFQRALATTKDAVGVSAGNMNFLKLVKNSDLWVYGPKDTEVEEGSLWAINPMSLMTGFVAWKGGKPVGKKLGSIFNPPITQDQLHEVGAKWDEAISFQLVCVSGEDVGTLCEYSANSYGGRKAFTEVMDAMMKQSGIDADKIVPIVDLKSDSYDHKEYGKTFNPIFEIVEWRSMAKGAAAEEPAGEEPTDVEEVKTEALPAATRRGRATDKPVDVHGNEHKAAAAETKEEPVRRTRRRAAG